MLVIENLVPLREYCRQHKWPRLPQWHHWIYNKSPVAIACIKKVEGRYLIDLTAFEANMKKFVLAPYVRVGFLEGTLHFGFGSLGQIIKEKIIQNGILDAAVFLKKPHQMDEVESFLCGCGYTLKDTKNILDILSKNFLIPENAYDREERHSRSFLFYSLSGAEIKNVQKEVSNK